MLSMLKTETYYCLFMMKQKHPGYGRLCLASESVQLCVEGLDLKTVSDE